MNTLYIKDGQILSKNKIVLYKLIEDEEMQVVNPSHEMLLEDGWQIYEAPPETLEQTKLNKIQEIDIYDKSPDVNSFILNGSSAWLSKSDRVGLMNSINIEKAAGRESSILWFNGIKFQIDCSTAIQLLSALELYALECYNVTASHKANVDLLQTIEDINNYNYMSGYPDKITINI